MSADYWVAYPAGYGEANARTAVRTAIARAELDLLGLAGC
jgi:hypothetical protein